MKRLFVLILWIAILIDPAPCEQIAVFPGHTARGFWNSIVPGPKPPRIMTGGEKTSISPNIFRPYGRCIRTITESTSVPTGKSVTGQSSLFLTARAGC